jgi:hypothetical protein
MRCSTEKRRWSGYPRQGLTPDEAATFLLRLAAGKSIGQLPRGAANPEYLVPVPRYLVHRRNDGEFKAKVDAIVTRPGTLLFGRRPAS